MLTSKKNYGYSSSRTGVGTVAMRSLVDDVESLSLVKECRELEEGFGTHYVDELVSEDADAVCMKEVKKIIGARDRERRLERCTEKAPLIAEVARSGGWLRLWDAALDLGVRHTKGLQAVSRLMSHHGRGRKPCPLCDVTDLPISVLEHVLSDHRDTLHLDMTVEQIIAELTSGNVLFLYHFWKLFCYG